MKKIFLLIGALAFITTAFTFRNAKQEDPWKVPEKYEKLKNPVPADEASIASGKELYIYFCKSCHGLDGKGSGSRSTKLDRTPTDFTTDAFQSQSDGAILFKIYSGHSEMPAFKKKMPANTDAMEGTFGKTRIPGDLVNFVRSLGKLTINTTHH